MSADSDSPADRTPPEATEAAALRRLAGRIGHDLNNFLFVIEANLDLLREGAASDAGLRAPLDAIERSSQLLGMLAANLSTFGGRQAVHAERVDAAAVLSRGLTALRRILPKSIAVRERVPSDLWAVQADSRLLLSAVLNLGLNARDAMPEGGTLEITAENRSVAAGVAPENASARPGDYMALTFRDDGMGMTEAQVARALGGAAPRVGGDDDPPLGLEMVRALARALGGALSIESAPGGGAAVTLLLPRAV